MNPNQNILDYLPHRPPFVMIDTIRVDDSSRAHSSFLIPENNPLVENGHFSESGIIENMAQTAGAATGLNAISNGKAPTIGYIGALKNLEIMELPAVGQILKTEIIFVHQVMNALIVEGTSSCEGKMMATCELKIFILN